MINTSTSTDAEGYLAITSNLIIPSVVTADAGIYNCTANNTEGMDSRIFNLTVYCKFALFLLANPVTQLLPDTNIFKCFQYRYYVSINDLC